MDNQRFLKQVRILLKAINDSGAKPILARLACKRRADTRLEWLLRRKAQGSQQLSYHRQPGDLVFFEDAIGFRSQAHNPHLRPDKAVFIQDGYFVA